MKVAGGKKIAEYIGAYPESRAALARWTDIVRAMRRSNTADVRATFRSADFVEGKVVFNVGGNNHRIIARIAFTEQIVAVLAVLSHKEYDKDKWK